MRRSIVIPLTLILLAAMVAIPIRATANTICCQVWGIKNGAFSGTQAYIVTKYQSISSGQSGAQTALTNLYVVPFIESGYTSLAGNAYAHPYSSYGDASGGLYQVNLTTRNLGNGLQYRYNTYFMGGTTWGADFTSGSGTYVIVRPDLMSGAWMPYVLSGGESTYGATTSIKNPIGPLATKSNKFWNGSLLSWCYTSTILTGGGSVSACSNYGWTVQAP